MVVDGSRDLERLEGWRIGPVPLAVTAERASNLVAATGDDPERWTAAAPPSFASVTLFAVAARLLAAPELAGRGVIHAEQSFEWHRPFSHGERGRGGRCRRSGPVEGGDHVRRVRRDHQRRLRAGAIVVVELRRRRECSGRAERPGSEPAPEERAATDIPLEQPLPAVGSPLPPLEKSASRGDLLRYAAATGDWNPIHWDHAAAVSAGLPGIVAHGLLMASWVVQAAARHSKGETPLRQVRLRFRSPLRPGEPATVGGEVHGERLAAHERRFRRRGTCHRYGCARAGGRWVTPCKS